MSAGKIARVQRAVDRRNDVPHEGPVNFDPSPLILQQPLFSIRCRSRSVDRAVDIAGFASWQSR
jgi:hypothetical protein